MNDEEQEASELRNPFPAPPSHYANYTTHNSKLLSLLKERVGDADISTVNQYEVLSDQKDVPDWPLVQLEKPRVDWILEEDGRYNVFGEDWFVKERISSLADQGGHQLFPLDPSEDRRPALQSILRSMLVSYSALTSSLLAPPPTTSAGDTPPEWAKHAHWIEVLAQNLMAAANEIRPAQARVNLETMMQRQVHLRREETRALHSKCDELEAKLTELRASARRLANGGRDEQNGLTEGSIQPTSSQFTSDDVLRWAEDIG